MFLIIALSLALALILSLSLSPSFHTRSPFFFFLFKVITGSWDSFMTFILLGSSLPLSFLSSSLSLSVNYPCTLICRHPSNLRLPVMNQVPPPSPPSPPLPVSAKQLTNQLALIKYHRKSHPKLTTEVSPIHWWTQGVRGAGVKIVQRALVVCGGAPACTKLSGT